MTTHSVQWKLIVETHWLSVHIGYKNHFLGNRYFSIDFIDLILAIITSHTVIHFFETSDYIAEEKFRLIFVSFCNNLAVKDRHGTQQKRPELSSDQPTMKLNYNYSRNRIILSKSFHG